MNTVLDILLFYATFSFIMYYLITFTFIYLYTMFFFFNNKYCTMTMCSSFM